MDRKEGDRGEVEWNNHRSKFKVGNKQELKKQQYKQSINFEITCRRGCCWYGWAILGVQRRWSGSAVDQLGRGNFKWHVRDRWVYIMNKFWLDALLAILHGAEGFCKTTGSLLGYFSNRWGTFVAVVVSGRSGCILLGCRCCVAWARPQSLMPIRL